MGASLRDRAGGLAPRAVLRSLGLLAILIPCAALAGCSKHQEPVGDPHGHMFIGGGVKFKAATVEVPECWNRKTKPKEGECPNGFSVGNWEHVVWASAGCNKAQCSDTVHSKGSDGRWQTVTRTYTEAECEKNKEPACRDQWNGWPKELAPTASDNPPSPDTPSPSSGTDDRQRR
jgi:hypothetical protein